ncbi:NAD(P)H-hydrate epimerase [Gulosibacter sediminis]|uniref:NAD(P)H-hydrate epimerase n=1 Tax=Gulosibacter TaxID=256818 RepID=UPI0039A4A048
MQGPRSCSSRIRPRSRRGLRARMCWSTACSGSALGGVAAGGSPALREPVRSVIVAVKAAIAEADPLVMAVDIPSGIDPDDGRVPDPDAVLRAHMTITFIGMKAGLLLDPAKSFAGKVWLEPIGAMQGLLRVTPAMQLP